jgi:putative redox protein
MSVQVTVRLGEGYATESSARDHHWPADVPLAEGGADAAPTPEELLLGALGSCTAMTLRMYAARRGWPLSGVTVELVGPKVDRIERRIEVAGDLTDDQIRRLLEIAEKCPVHRILTRLPTVVTQIRRA